MEGDWLGYIRIFFLMLKVKVNGFFVVMVFGIICLKLVFVV